MRLPDPLQAAVIDHFESGLRRRVDVNMVQMHVRDAIELLIAEYEANGFVIPNYEIGPVTRDEDGRMRVTIQMASWPDVRPIDTNTKGI